jgi:FtsH-binding integral membrane protein
MSHYFAPTSAPITLSKTGESQVYTLFAVAMALTVVGTYAGLLFAPVLLGSGLQIFFLIAELLVIFTSSFWVNRSPLNYLLFAVFPLLSGLTFAPYALSILAGYANGGAILLNALAATVCMSLAAAVVARMSGINTFGWGKPLVLGIIGLLVLSLMQVFIPAFRAPQFEILISGAGIVLFALFLTYDLQRIQQMARTGVHPISLALSLYLDIFNLFLYILRFMTALSGRDR